MKRVLAALRRITARTWVRAGFFAVFLLSCIQLWRYYRWSLTGVGPVARPEATAGFVPLGGMMSLFAWLKGGQFDLVMPAAVIIILGALALSLLAKRGFCGFICPVGSLANAAGWLGRKLNGGKRRPLNGKLDLALRLPKYALAAFFLFTIASLPVEVALQFQKLPYYATSDMKILYGILHPSAGYLIFAGFFLVTSVALGSDTWCRYLCPLGALYGGLSAASPGTVRRDESRCIECGACDEACQARIAVAKSTRPIRHPECDGCQDCVAACPEPGALTTRYAGLNLPHGYWPALVIVIWLAVLGIAQLSGYWQQGLDDATIAGHMRSMNVTADWGQDAGTTTP